MRIKIKKLKKTTTCGQLAFKFTSVYSLVYHNMARSGKAWTFYQFFVAQELRPPFWNIRD